MAEHQEIRRSDNQQRRRVILWAKRLGYVVFLLVCLELSLQAFYRVTNGAFLYQRMAIHIFQADPIRGWAVKPNMEYSHTTNEYSVQLYTNSQGMRVSKDREEFAIEKDPVRYRVMLLGPSFAFGWAADFEDSFAQRLETHLEAAGLAAGRDVEIINAGVPSLPPANNLNWYQQVGKRYRPDLVIQLIYWSMGASNNASDEYVVTKDGYLVPRGSSTGQRLKGVAKKSGVVFYAWMTYARIKGWLGGGASSAEGSQGPDSPPSPSQVLDLDHPDVIDSLKFYSRLRTSVTGDGSRLVVVFVPAAYYVHREDLDRWSHTGAWDIDGEIAYNRAFCEQVTSRGIACLNLQDSLVNTARSNEDRLYYWLDSHWTALGNDVAARAVADYLSACPDEQARP